MHVSNYALINYSKMLFIPRQMRCSKNQFQLIIQYDDKSYLYIHKRRLRKKE